jgi:hypothetical protein
MRETITTIAGDYCLVRWWYDGSRVRTETFVRMDPAWSIKSPYGPHRDYDLDGRLVREIFLLPTKVLSLAEYEEARSRDPVLPPPTVPPPTGDMYEAFQRERMSDPRYREIERNDREAFCSERLREEGTKRLGQVLAECSGIVVGERSQRASATLLRSMSALPCREVYAMAPGITELDSTSLSHFVLRAAGRAGAAEGRLRYGAPLAALERLRIACRSR